MKRLHLFEIEDQPWFPEICRNFLTDFLESVSNLTGVYDVCLPLIERLQAATGTRRILDLCSGAGGPWPRWARTGQIPGEVLLSDRFPNRTAYSRLERDFERIGFCSHSVEALEAPKSLAKVHTLFTAIHHLKPEDLSQLLQRCQKEEIALGAFDFNQRSLWTLLGIPLLALVSNWLITPFLKPFSWKRLLLTYLIPVVPLAAAWDGLASQLRSYKPEELREMTDSLQCSRYQWQVETRHRFGVYPVTCLIGFPVKTQRSGGGP